MAPDETEREKTFEEAGFSKIDIQGVTGYWRSGVLCYTDINDKSTEFWDMSKIQIYWDTEDITYVMTARDVPPEELMVFAASMVRVN